ncbi:MAG: histidine kinase, partial [Chitinophagales bacterium]
GSFDKGDDERFYIGGQHKVIAFYPSALNMPISVPEPVITSLKIFDTPFPLDFFLKSMLPLTLSYNQNMLTLQFTAPNFIHNNSMRFSYWMEGLDKNWNVSGAGRMASYSNMRPGNYIFHVKASAINGQWSNHEAKLNIIIAPPFWETWWFRLTAVFSLIALIVLIIYFMVSRIRKREAEKTAFNTQLAEVEMKALRAQMNPHFLFNALNSIQECVVTNQNDAAYNYLSKFSRLVRLILENSEQTMVIVKKEMDALKLYLDLESLRFQNFTYTITIDKSIDQDVEQIPSMLIQPFAENALKHGLATKQGSRFLKIQLLKDKNMLHCTVEDNGIGRRQAEVLKSAMQKDHASRGMQITEERIRLIGSKTKMDVQLNISDLYDEEHHPAGTRVDITIPHENDTA